MNVKMKRILCILLIISMLLGCMSALTACGNDSGSGDTSTESHPELTESNTSHTERETTKAETKIETTETEIETTVTEAETTETEVETTVTEVETTETEVETTGTEVETTETEAETTETEVETTVTEVETTETEVETTVTEVKTTETEVETTVTEVKTTVTEVETIETEVETTVTEVETTEPEVETTETEVETTEPEVETTEPEVETTETEVETTETETETETTETEAETTETEVETTVTEVETTETEVETTETEAETTETEVETTELETTELVTTELETTESVTTEPETTESATTETEVETPETEVETPETETETTETEVETTETETETTETETETTETETEKDPVCMSHIDDNGNDYCDVCNEYLIVIIDFYAFNDLHGKFCDTATQPGVDELGTYFSNRLAFDDHVILLSSGDMWQGAAESSLLYGKIIVEWMNALGFVSMTLGNHEFDWGEAPIRDNLAIADFPFLAINVYDRSTGELADYCTPSILIERDGIQIGIIGALGDCYSSISSDMVSGVTFKVGSELTALVKSESEKLRAQGADIIVYSLHDGAGEGYTYDASLSQGYVDVVFEAHTHQSYVTRDDYGVYHVQGGGENQGMSHIEVSVHSLSGELIVTEADVIGNTAYKDLPDHQKTEEIEDRYSDVITLAYTELGEVSTFMSDSDVEDLVAQLYLEAGLEKWGDQYNIVLGVGFLKTRSPYNLSEGTKTYADLFSLLPFNNPLVLCSVSGSKLKSVFINTTNSDYHTALSDYGKNLSISNSAKYYVVVDTYTALYSYNGLTIVEYLDETTYARDLFAEAIKDGRLSGGGYTFTPIPDILAIGKNLAVGESTSEYYYVKATVKSINNSTYGNIYVKDENGNELLIYRLYDADGNLFISMPNKPQVGDVITVRAQIYRYNSTTVEFQNATLVAIE